MGINKTVLQMTVLHHHDFDPAAISLAQLAYELDDGECIGGDLVAVTSENVPRHKLEDELMAVGNDGSFFELEDAEEGE